MICIGKTKCTSKKGLLSADCTVNNYVNNYVNINYVNNYANSTNCCVMAGCPKKNDAIERLLQFMIQTKPQRDDNNGTVHLYRFIHTLTEVQEVEGVFPIMDNTGKCETAAFCITNGFWGLTLWDESLFNTLLVTPSPAIPPSLTSSLPLLT